MQVCRVCSAMIILVTGSCFDYLLTLLLQWSIFPLLIKRQLTVTFCTHPASDCILFSVCNAVSCCLVTLSPIASLSLVYNAVSCCFVTLSPLASFSLRCNAVSCCLVQRGRYIQGKLLVLPVRGHAVSSRSV